MPSRDLAGGSGIQGRPVESAIGAYLANAAAPADSSTGAIAQAFEVERTLLAGAEAIFSLSVPYQLGSGNAVTSTGLPITNEMFLVDDLKVDLAQQRVTRADIEIALPYLSFQLLVALIRAAPDIISNDQIMARVWPGLVVSPETVAKRVNLLRDALGDDAQDPRYIAGVRGRGYRLVAAVSRAVAPVSMVEEPAPASPAAPLAIEVPTPADPPGGAKSAATSTARGVWLLLSIPLVVISANLVGLHLAGRSTSAGGRPEAEGLHHPAEEAAVPARTVAVLPFDNISADATDAYLAQGLPEMILNRLSRVEGLSVIARSSSFAIPTRNIDSREIGRRLDAGYLITGSVQREADRLRVAVHVVDSSAGILAWSAHFDRGLHDIFSVEDEIGDQIAGVLSARLGAAATKPLAGARSDNLEAYLAFLRGRTLLGRFTVVESESAIPCFERAIALDPAFAPAYASLYDARMQAADKRRENMNVARQRNRHLIDRAIELDPGLGAAYFARAMWGDVPNDASATPDNPLVAAREADFRRGVALDPSNGRGLEAYAEFLTYTLERP